MVVQRVCPKIGAKTGINSFFYINWSWSPNISLESEPESGVLCPLMFALKKKHNTHTQQKRSTKQIAILIQAFLFQYHSEAQDYQVAHVQRYFIYMHISFSVPWSMMMYLLVRFAYTMTRGQQKFLLCIGAQEQTSYFFYKIISNFRCRWRRLLYIGFPTSIFLTILQRATVHLQSRIFYDVTCRAGISANSVCNVDVTVCRTLLSGSNTASLH